MPEVTSPKMGVPVSLKRLDIRRKLNFENDIIPFLLRVDGEYYVLDDGGFLEDEKTLNYRQVDLHVIGVDGFVTREFR